MPMRKIDGDEFVRRAPLRDTSFDRQAPLRNNSLTQMLQQGRRLQEERQNQEKEETPSRGGSVSFEVDYGYDVDVVEPRTKKRRFERRNSKTPAMLLAMSTAASALPQLDFLDEDNNDLDEASKPQFSYVDDDDDESTWGGGLDIAEQLVSQLKQRRSRMRL
uniref:Uncharacterized protein n=1 Tax=Phaeodactylum tricornutum TaxID=2850 RepID=A0A8J9T8G1_PHATR